MITPIYGADAVVAQFVGQLIGEPGFGNCKAIGFAKGRELVAGMVYHNWRPDAQIIEMSGASTTRRWTTKAVIRTIFGYPFDTVGCQMVVARHSEHNTRVRRIWTALGAQETVIPRIRGRDEAEVIATLTVEAWRSNKLGASNG